jgi:hypothetical protein
MFGGFTKSRSESKRGKGGRGRGSVSTPIIICIIWVSKQARCHKKNKGSRLGKLLYVLLWDGSNSCSTRTISIRAMPLTRGALCNEPTLLISSHIHEHTAKPLAYVCGHVTRTAFQLCCHAYIQRRDWCQNYSDRTLIWTDLVKALLSTI